MADRFDIWGADALATYWPVAAMHANDLYFYLEKIEAYLPHNRVRVSGYGEMLLFGGYSYLGLNQHPRISSAAADAIAHYGTGCHGTRMLAGTLDLHHRLERRLATFLGTESAATFSSGYFANVSTISALVARDDVILCDKLDHASIVDGCQLSGARIVRYRHNDTAHLERLLIANRAARRRLVIVDSVYSMDGDIVDLPEVVRLCRTHGAILMVDEAHSIGVLGATGRGIEEHFGLPAGTIDIKMGTLSKAIPSTGGYIAGSERLCHYLRHQARGFIYSGSLTPAAAAAGLAALDVIDAEPERVAALHDNTRTMASMLRGAGLSFLESTTSIFPIICGEDWQAFRVARACQRRGIFVQAIPHPVVPKGLARLRVAVTATHRVDDLELFVDVLRDAADACDLPRERVHELAA
jgi:8-amino-7-oxononanoate synthase